MSFTPKQWKDYPDPAALVRGADLTDLEQRVYTGAVGDVTGTFGKRLFIPGQESIGNTSGAYVSMPTPDTIANIPTETGDLVQVCYSAMWIHADDLNTSIARLHFDGTHIVLPQRTGATPSRSPEARIVNNPLFIQWLTTGPMGLYTANAGSNATPTAPQNGMIAGQWVDGAAVDHSGGPATTIRADAGLHTVEIKFLCGPTTLSVKSRELRVRVIKYPA